MPLQVLWVALPTHVIAAATRLRSMSVMEHCRSSQRKCVSCEPPREQEAIMFGKVFEIMYDGTLRTNWQALVAFQQMIVLANIDGVVDMTPEAIAARTGIPLEIFTEGIA